MDQSSQCPLHLLSLPTPYSATSIVHSSACCGCCISCTTCPATIMLGDSVSPRVAAMTVPSVATHTVCSPLLAFLMIATGRSSRFTLCSPFTIPACASTVKRRLQGNSQTPSLLHAQIAKTQAWSSSAMQVIYCTWQRRSAHQDDQRVDALQRHPVDGACIMAAQHRIAAGQQLVC